MSVSFFVFDSPVMLFAVMTGGSRGRRLGTMGGPSGNRAAKSRAQAGVPATSCPENTLSRGVGAGQSRGRKGQSGVRQASPKICWAPHCLPQARDETAGCVLYTHTCAMSELQVRMLRQQSDKVWGRSVDWCAYRACANSRNIITGQTQVLGFCSLQLTRRQSVVWLSRQIQAL